MIFNPALLLGWWKEILIGLLCVAIGVQSYRLQGAKAEVAVFEERQAAQIREQAYRELQAIKNKERTDAQYELDLRRARAVVVRDSGAPVVAGEPTVTLGGDEPTVCFERGRLERELAGWAGRAAAGLGQLAARNADRLAGDAQSGEAVAAAFRACQAFVLNLDR